MFKEAVQAGVKISTHTLLAERDVSEARRMQKAPSISTHTLLAERDYTFMVCYGFRCNFYSHAPRGA